MKRWPGQKRTLRMNLAHRRLLVLAFLLGEMIFDEAYRGRSLSLANRHLSGPGRHPVGRHRVLEGTASPTGLFLVAAGSLGLLRILHPAVRTRLFGTPGGSDPAHPFENSNIPVRRRRIVQGMIIVILLGSLREIVTNPSSRREHWPFSPYKMYSRIPGKLWSGRRLFGVTGGTPGREIPLLDEAFIEPLELVSLSASLDRLDAGRNRETLLTAALRNCLDRYETLRRAGRHNGPPLRALRLYRLSWRIEAPDKSFSTGRELRFEVTQ